MVADTQITDALVEIRKEIDGVDLQIIELLLKRFNLVRKAAAEKESLDLVNDGRCTLVGGEQRKNMFVALVPYEELEANQLAAKNCPVNVIRVEEC
jgi:chorismate mutase